MWTQAYRYRVYNGVKTVKIKIKQHLPSHLLIAGHETLIYYDCQPPTCYCCNAIDHQQQECPRRRATGAPAQNPQTSTWADVVAHSNTNTQHTTEHSIVKQPQKMRDEEFGTYDTWQFLENTNSKTNEMIQDTFSVTELDPLVPLIIL